MRHRIADPVEVGYGRGDFVVGQSRLDVVAQGHNEFASPI